MLRKQVAVGPDWATLQFVMNRSLKDEGVGEQGDNHLVVGGRRGVLVAEADLGDLEDVEFVDFVGDDWARSVFGCSGGRSG
jgi:hypothetical protein